MYTSWIPSICKNLTFILLSKNSKGKKYTIEEISKFIKTKNIGKLYFINEHSFIGLMNPPIYLQKYDLAS